MRVISQDGMTDIPYEMFVFGVTEDNAIVGIRDTISRPSDVALGVVAKYSTKEKVLKVMEMLRKQYCSLEASDNLSCGSIGYLTECSLTEVEQIVNIAKEDYYFQFPKDEDVEV